MGKYFQRSSSLVGKNPERPGRGTRRPGVADQNIPKLSEEHFGVGRKGLVEVPGGDSRAQTPPVPSPDRPPRLRRGETPAEGPAENPSPPGRCSAAAGGPSRARRQRPGAGTPAQTGKEGPAGDRGRCWEHSQLPRFDGTLTPGRAPPRFSSQGALPCN